MNEQERRLEEVLITALAEREIPVTRRGTEHFIVELPGTRKLKTTTLLTVSRHGVRVEAFVCRRPDDEHRHVYEFLLRRNRKLYGVAYTLDQMGDVYLTGQISAEGFSADELDRYLGQVLEAADGDFNTLLELGFAESIRREWNWRVSRGESLANLAAFAHLVENTGDEHSDSEHSDSEHSDSGHVDS